MSKLLFMLCVVLLSASVIMVREWQFRKMSMCPGLRNMTLLFENVKFQRNQRGKTVALNLDILVKKRINKLKLSISIWKCELSGDPDSCEFYMKNYNSSVVCDILSQKNQIWTTYMDHMTLPRHCPIEPGRYYVKDAPIDDDQLAIFPIPNGLWKIEIKEYDEKNTYICCLDVEYTISFKFRN